MPNKNQYRRNKEKYKSYEKQYYLQNRKRILKRGKERYCKNREKILERNRFLYKIKRDERKIKIEKILGKICLLCGSNERINYHEIHGKKHAVTLRYILAHPEDFVPLCRRCHYILHNCVRNNLNLEQFSLLFRMLHKGEK